MTEFVTTQPVAASIIPAELMNAPGIAGTGPSTLPSLASGSGGSVAGFVAVEIGGVMVDGAGDAIDAVMSDELARCSRLPL